MFICIKCGGFCDEAAKVWTASGQICVRCNDQLWQVKKPPLGAMPRKLHDESRLRDLQGAISRAYDAEYEINTDLVNEYNEIIKRWKNT